MFLALCVHWLNLLVWLMFVLLGRDMEMSCDEAVIKKLGENVRADYSALLLRLATGRKLIAGAPLAFGEGDTRDRLVEILKNAEFGYVGGCGYGDRVTLTSKSGEKFTFFKGTDGCDMVVFGYWSGYFLGDAENTEFWQIFGLDPETKESM